MCVCKKTGSLLMHDVDDTRVSASRRSSEKIVKLIHNV